MTLLVLKAARLPLMRSDFAPATMSASGASEKRDNALDKASYHRRYDIAGRLRQA